MRTTVHCCRVVRAEREIEAAEAIWIGPGGFPRKPSLSYMRHRYMIRQSRCGDSGADGSRSGTPLLCHVRQDPRGDGEGDRTKGRMD